MRAVGGLLTGLLLAGCGLPGLIRQEERAADLVARGDALARAGDFGTAEATYRRVLDAPLRDRPADRPADRALLGLGRLYVSPDNANRDYRQAYQQFDRLTREYPESPVAGEARAWRDLLGVVLREREETTRAVLREREETTRARQETIRARQETDRLRRELQQARQEAEAIRQDLERLKRLELELERRRR